MNVDIKKTGENKTDRVSSEEALIKVMGKQNPLNTIQKRKGNLTVHKTLQEEKETNFF